MACSSHPCPCVRAGGCLRLGRRSGFWSRSYGILTPSRRSVSKRVAPCRREVRRDPPDGSRWALAVQGYSGGVGSASLLGKRVIGVLPAIVGVHDQQVGAGAGGGSLLAWTVSAVRSSSGIADFAVRCRSHRQERDGSRSAPRSKIIPDSRSDCFPSAQEF